MKWPFLGRKNKNENPSPFPIPLGEQIICGCSITIIADKDGTLKNVFNYFPIDMDAKTHIGLLGVHEELVKNLCAASFPPVRIPTSPKEAN